jgi:hypothetical protein
MRVRIWISVGFALMLAMLPVYGQEVSTDTTTPSVETTPAPPLEEAPAVVVETPSSIETDVLDLQFGFDLQSVTGNRFKFEQYATPQEGLLLKRLLLFRSLPGSGLVAMDVYLPGRIDTSQLYQFWTAWPINRFRLSYNAWRGHPVFSDLSVERKIWGADMDMPLSRDPKAQLASLWTLQAYLNSLDYSTNFEAFLPQRPFVRYPDFLVRSSGVTIVSPIKAAFVRLSHTANEFEDHTGYQPKNIVQENSIEAVADFGPNVTSKLTVSQEDTAVDSRNSTYENSFGHNIKETNVKADVQGLIGDAVTLRAYFTNMEMDREFNSSGYAKNVTSAGGRLALVSIKGLLIRTGYDSRSIDYLASDHSTTYNPKVDTAWLAVRAKPLKELEIWMILTDRLRRKLPPSQVEGEDGLTLEAPLVPRHMVRTEYGATYTPQDNWGFSYRFIQERENNPYSDMIYRIKQSDLSGWVQITDSLSASASYGHHIYRSRFLDNFTSDTWVVTSDVSYTINKTWWVEASYAESASAMASDIAERNVGLSVHAQVSSNTEASVEYSSQKFDDNEQLGRDYDSDRIAFWLRKKY